MDGNWSFDEDKEFGDVQDFHKKFKQITNATPTHLTRRKLAERVNFMMEELMEFAEASGLELDFKENGAPNFIADEENADQNMELQADSLIDLVYVAKGTGVMMGLPWKKLWDDVQRANMAKVLGETHRARANPGQFLMDVSKPEGWVPPTTGQILEIAGYKRIFFCSLDGNDEHAIYVVDDKLCADDEVYK